MPQDCCSGINGSHTKGCRDNEPDRAIVCWCCGETLPASASEMMSWSWKGARCEKCEECPSMCRAAVHSTL